MPTKKTSAEVIAKRALRRAKDWLVRDACRWAFRGVDAERQSTLIEACEEVYELVGRDLNRLQVFR